MDPSGWMVYTPSEVAPDLNNVRQLVWAPANTTKLTQTGPLDNRLTVSDSRKEGKKEGASIPDLERSPYTMNHSSHSFSLMQESPKPYTPVLTPALWKCPQ